MIKVHPKIVELFDLQDCVYSLAVSRTPFWPLVVTPTNWTTFF
jgi:hypothetical protein